MSADAQKALTTLRQLITSSALGAGGQLPTERALAERLGIGRRALRAALEVLEEEGLLWRRQGKGTFIGQPPDPHGQIAADIVRAVDAATIMEARLCVEPALAALAAGRASMIVAASTARTMSAAIWPCGSGGWPMKVPLP